MKVENVWTIGFVAASIALSLFDIWVGWLGTVWHVGPLLLMIVFLIYRKHYVLKEAEKDREENLEA
ncbi:MAG: hypothetical protein KGZ25_12505 [Planctomycetes bacterium]|nr:hypothetical protein [Planctomycetota bacterium]